eukprot:CAMPEP_0169064772 /NCGR_PEP_ID=MMETSP1015-20121227/2026_1 /TAXON_ID=342587 /ORGANISM="Karlodinium micrum, Strain CCMP2283" /LENGTH=846 /DNA_ID=CAMNT_0009123257 /DNA_START=238 /DNA_END=2778 /DNA_ORIENTATION=+
MKVEVAGEEDYLLAHKKDQKPDKETKKMISLAMNQDRVCAILEEKETAAILQTMELFEFKAGERVIRQGDVGNTFFVTNSGSLEVRMDDKPVNTLGRGTAFGGLSLLYQCPRTASVSAVADSSVWGASGDTFHMVLAANAKSRYAENRKFLDSIKLFDGLSVKIKDNIGECFFSEIFEPGSRIVTEGEAAAAMYFVKKGELGVMEKAVIEADGKTTGTVRARMGPGDSFGERGLLYKEPRSSTVVAESRSELLCIAGDKLRDVLGGDLSAILETNLILSCVRKSPLFSQFSGTQQSKLVEVMKVRSYEAGAKVETGLRLVVIVDGGVEGSHESGAISLVRGDWFEEDALTANVEAATSQKQGPIKDLVAGAKGTRLGILMFDDFTKALRELGVSAAGSADEAIDYTRKAAIAKKVHIFRALSTEQFDKLVKAFQLQRYVKGGTVIKQGEIGTSFFVIASGEVTISIDGNVIRTLAKNAYIGERALLFDEPRSATVVVSSNEAELWSVNQAMFKDIVKGNMLEDLMMRIRLQDTSVTMKDLKHVSIVGAGAAGVVRLVEHKSTKTRYALKRVQKQSGKVPEEVSRECSLLKENDHPFIMTLVKVFETAKSVYMLTELITGGELHAAIRTIPTVLSRSQAQFYTGSLVLVLEETSDRNIVYRDLKPENVMLDAQGYLKLIDFGIAKKLEEGKPKTFTMIGTPHYMAPEVMRGHGYSTEIDVWSLGVMLFEFVCGYLPFADDLDEPTEVCTAVLKDPLSFPSGYKDKNGRDLMVAMLCRQPKKRIGSGINGYDEIKNHEFFKVGHEGGSLFNKILGRELAPPVIPKKEQYCDPEDVADIVLSDADELCK